MADAQALEQPVDGTPNPTEPTQQAEPAAEPQKEGVPKRSSIFDEVGIDEPGKPGSTTWPDTWREEMAAATANEKALELFKRYASPTEFAKAHVSLVEKLRTGELKRAMPPPEGADEATIKAWREERGLPPTPDDYKVPTLAGVDFENLDETTRADLNEFRTAAHGTNMTQTQADAAMGVAIKLAERQMERQADADAANMERLDDTLRAEWGREFKQNLRTTHAWLTQQFGDATDAILLARMPDGQRVADNPAFLKAMAQAARGSGSDVFVDEGGGQPMGLEGRRAEIEAIMKTDYNRYLRELEPEYTKILNELDRRGKL